MISLLCVNTKPELFDNIRRKIEEKGDFSVTTSHSVEEALILLKKQPFEVILVGSGTQGVEGTEILQTARQNGCHSPFIFFDCFKDQIQAPDQEEMSTDLLKGLVSAITATRATQKPDQTTKHGETLFRTIADRTTVAVLIHRDGNLIYANHAAEELTGYSREELQAFDHLNIVHPDEREEARVRAERRLESGLPTERYIVRILQEDGSERAVEVTADRCHITESTGLVLSTLDPVAAKQIEQTQRPTSSPSLDLYFRSGMDGTIEMVSFSCCKILGWNPDEAKGQKVTKYLQNPAEAEEIGRLLWASESLHDHEVHLLRKDGTAVILSLNACLIRRGDGARCGIEGVLHNIAGRKQIEKELSLHRTPLAATLQATKDSILATDKDGVPIASNEIQNTRNRPDRIQHGVLECTDNRTIEYLSRSPMVGDETTGRVWRFSDITGEEDSEKKQQEEDNFFTALIEAIRDGVLILHQNGTVKYANRAACELVGLRSAEDCVGRNLLEFVHKDSTHAIFRDMLTVRGGSDDIPAEYTFVTPTGRMRQVESLSSTIFWKEEKAIAVTLRDVTERKQAEAAAQESADLNRALIDGLPEYIFVLTPEMEIIFANPAAEAALGCTRGTLPGKAMQPFIGEQSLEDFTTVVQDAATGQKCRSIEIGIRTAENNVLQVTLRAAPITFRNRDAVLVLFTDLTERLILEKELEYHADELKRFSESLTRTNEKLTIMNSITRHDILNQLTVLLGYQGIAEEESRDPAVLESLDKIKFSAQSIREQLEFTRDYQDLGVREPQWFDVRWQIARLKMDGITIDTRIRKLEVYADPLFGRVFYNLLDNAVRHGNRVTKIRVTTRTDDDGALTIVWEDNGIGVREGDKEKIFKRGYGSNTGLGLFLCREILAITGMTIRECGEYENGARFEIRVPPGNYRRHADRKSTPPDRA